MEIDYLSNVLIKLKRKYEKDEVLKAVIKENKELIFEIGQLKSEILHLEYLINEKELLELKVIEL
jgi:hypothetical protein